MSDENTQETKIDDNKMSISVEEYNTLKANAQVLQTLKSKLDDKEKEFGKLQASLEELGKKKAPSREEIEQQLRTEFGEKLNQFESEKTQLAAKLKRLTVTDKVMSKLADKIVPDAHDFFRTLIEKHCDLEGDFDSGKIVIKDNSGNKRWSTKRPDQEMTDEEFVEVLGGQYPSFFVSKARSAEAQNGASKQYGATSKSQYTMSDFANMSDQELRSLPQEQLVKALRGI